MTRIQETGVSPKGARFKALWRATSEAEIDDLILWANENTKGRIWWSKTHFRHSGDRKTVFNVRQRHFKGGYWMVTMWFSKMADAAVFRLFWTEE